MYAEEEANEAYDNFETIRIMLNQIMKDINDLTTEELSDTPWVGELPSLRDSVTFIMMNSVGEELEYWVKNPNKLKEMIYKGLIWIDINPFIITLKQTLNIRRNFTITETHILGELLVSVVTQQQQREDWIAVLEEYLDKIEVYVPDNVEFEFSSLEHFLTSSYGEFKIPTTILVGWRDSHLLVASL